MGEREEVSFQQRQSVNKMHQQSLKKQQKPSIHLSAVYTNFGCKQTYGYLNEWILTWIYYPSYSRDVRKMGTDLVIYLYLPTEIPWKKYENTSISDARKFLWVRSNVCKHDIFD